MYFNCEAKPEHATAKIAVWWDMQDCPIPEGYDAGRVRSSIEGEFKKLGYSGPVSITAYDDHKQTPDHVLRGLSSSGVVVAHTVPKCRCARMFSDMLEWRARNPPPATMMLISDQLKKVFELELARLQQRTTYNFFQAYSVRSPFLIYLSTTADWLWKDLLNSSSSSSSVEIENETSAVFSCTMCSYDFKSLKYFRKHLKSRDHRVQEAEYPSYEELIRPVTKSWGRNYRANNEHATAKIAVWWDMQVCPIPEGCDATRLLPGLQEAFKSLGYDGPVSIYAYGDLNKTPDHVLQQLSSIGVVFSHTHTNVTIKAIFRDMEVWRSQNPPPATMMLISDRPDEQILAMDQQESTYAFFLAYSYRPVKTSLLVTSAEWLWDSFFFSTVSETRTQLCCSSESTEMFYCKLHCSYGCKDLRSLREHLSSDNHVKEEGSIEKALQWRLQKYWIKPEIKCPRNGFPRGFLDSQDKEDDHTEKDDNVETTSAKPDDVKDTKKEMRKKRRKAKALLKAIRFPHL